MIVADTSNQRLCVFNVARQFYRTITCTHRPYRLSMTGQGHVVALSSGSCSIHIYSLNTHNGALVTSFDIVPDDCIPTHRFETTAICAGYEESIYVATTLFEESLAATGWLLCYWRTFCS